MWAAAFLALALLGLPSLPTATALGDCDTTAPPGSPHIRVATRWMAPGGNTNPWVWSQDIPNDPAMYWGPNYEFHAAIWCSRGAGIAWDLVPFGTTTPLAHVVNAPVPTASFDFQPPSPFGVFSLRAASVDASGQWSADAIYSFGVDMVSPLVEKVYPALVDGTVSPTTPIQVWYNDKDPVGGVNRDEEQATTVLPQSVRLSVDRQDVASRETPECTQLGQDGPILGPAQQDAWDAVVAQYGSALQAVNGRHQVGPMFVTVDLQDEGLQGLFGSPLLPEGQTVPVYADALAILCGRIVATTSEYSYMPLKPWPSGPHAASVAFTDNVNTAHGWPLQNRQTYAWQFGTL